MQKMSIWAMGEGPHKMHGGGLESLNQSEKE
jgi:hypothetical protein